MIILSKILPNFSSDACETLLQGGGPPPCSKVSHASVFVDFHGTGTCTSTYVHVPVHVHLSGKSKSDPQIYQI